MGESKNQLGPIHASWEPQEWAEPGASDLGGINILHKSGPFIMEPSTHAWPKVPELMRVLGKAASLQASHRLVLTRWSRQMGDSTCFPEAREGLTWLRGCWTGRGGGLE